ncbi:MAG TPA: prolipoprotein diacylglyceryl transferase [Candidatus Omnitrophota bacterium]|nr:prolipoprotein diacylglyceryl transferase [Candidatus Omnitrophota bacterium]
MIPVIVSLGPLKLYSYGLLFAVGMVVSLILMRRRAVKEGFPAPDDCSDMMLVLLVWGVVGARLFYVLQNLSYYASDPLRVFAIWEGGLIFYGGAVSGLIGFIVTLRMKKIPFWRFLDFIVPYIALTQFFGRIGCFLNGCCFGKTCHLPWAVSFPHSGGPVHPAQLYEAFYTLLLFVCLRVRGRRARFEGEVGLLYFMLYALGRYLIEFVREPGLSWLGFTMNQWISIVMIVTAFIFFQARKSQGSARQ